MTAKVARNSVYSAIAGICTAFAGFISMVIVARCLGVSATGAIAYIIWLVSLIVMFFDFGVHSTLARYLPELTSKSEAPRVRALVVFLYRPYFALSFLCFAGFCAYAIWLALHQPPQAIAEWRGWQHNPVIWLLVGAICALQALSNFSLGYLRGMQQFDRAARLTLVSFIVQLVGVAIGALGFGVPGALVGYCLGASVLAIRSLAWWRGHADAPSDLMRRLARFACYTWAGGLAAAFVWSRAEVFFLERSWGPDAVAMLAVGLTFANLAAQGPILLTGALLAFFSENFAKNSIDTINAGYATGTRIMAFLAFPLCFGTAAILPSLLPMIYGPHFAEAIPAAGIVIIAAAFPATGAVGSHMLYGRDRSDLLFYANLAGAALTVVSGLTIIPAFGVIGAAAGRAVIHLCMVAIGCWFIQRRLGCPMPFADLGRLLLAAVLCAIAARLVVVLAPSSVALPLAVASGAAVYAAAVRWLGALPDGDLQRLDAIAQRLPRSLRWLPQHALRILAKQPPLAADGVREGN